MKIVLLSRFYPFVGGREMTVEHLAIALGKDHDVHVLTPDAGKVITEHYQLHRNLDGDETLRLIDEIGPDVIHAHAFYQVTDKVLRLAEKLSIPIVLTLHGDLLSHGEKKDIKHFKKIAPHLSRIVTVCNHGREELARNRIKARVVVIPNGIPVEKFDLSLSKRKLRKGFGLPPDTFLFLAPARFMKKKGLEFLLNAITQCDLEDTKFIFSAPASRTAEADRKYALKLWESAGAKKVKNKLQVILTDPTAMPFLLHSADAMVLPSETEQLPLAIIEAMVSNTPVIATDVGGVPELVKDGVTGLLVKYGDTQGLVDALRSIKINKPLRDRVSKNAHSKANGSHNVHTMTKAYTKLYESLV